MSVIVVKIGTNAILDDAGLIDVSVIENLAKGVATLRDQGHSIVLVASGAVGSAKKEFNAALLGKVSRIELAQIRSAVGQPMLMYRFRKIFQQYNIPVAQGLVTRSDFASRDHQLAMRNILERMFRGGILPILNENDFLTPEELDFSDNDQLASFLAGMLCADRLILLSNVDGLFTGHPKDPSSKKVDTVLAIDSTIENYVSQEKSDHGMGGMQSKIKTAKVLSQLGIEMVLANSRQPDILQMIFHDEQVGTRFLPQHDRKKSGIRVWLAAGAAESGKLIVDDNLAELLHSRAKSLSILAVGIKSIQGDFAEGEAIGIYDRHGKKYGRGVARISAEQMRAALQSGNTKGTIFVHTDVLFLL